MSDRGQSSVSFLLNQFPRLVVNLDVTLLPVTMMKFVFVFQRDSR